MGEEKYRLVGEGPPNRTICGGFWKRCYDEGAVVVSSTYAKVGGLYDFGFRHDPSRPLESLADYCLGCYTNLSLPSRIDMICKYMEEYEADGLLINSIKSCNSFSAGQLLILREVEKRTGKPAAFIETDLVDPRYFSAANVKNRLESYFQMVQQKRTAALAAPHPLLLHNAGDEFSTQWLRQVYSNVKAKKELSVDSKKLPDAQLVKWIAAQK